MASRSRRTGDSTFGIFVESKATDTIQNACYSERIMQAHGWHSAEIISSAYHLPRAAMIFSRISLDWRMHAAPPLQPGSAGSGTDSALETLKTMRYLVYAELGRALRALVQSNKESR